ncbi:MAG: MFS transporter [Ilumatobacteraceae bacterium]
MTSLDRAVAPADARLVTRPFVIVSAVTFLFFVYVGVLIPLIPRLIEEQLGGTELDIGLNLAVFSIAAVAMRPWLGRWGDRHGRRALIVGGALVTTLAVFAATLVADRWALLPLRAVMGAGEGALFVGAATLVNDLAPARRRAEAASYFSAAVFLGIGIGPIISEQLIGDSGFDRGLVAAGMFTLAAASVAMLLADDRPVRAPDAPPPAAPLNKFHRAALRPGAVLACGIGGFATFNAFVPEHARAVGLEGSKWVFALYSVICIVVRVVGARLPERIGLAAAVSIALAGLAIGLATIGIVATPVGLFAGTAVIGVGMSFMYPSLSAIAVNSAPSSDRTQVVSTFTMFFEVGSAIGGLLFGLVAELTSKRGGFIGGSLAAAAGLVVLWMVLLPWARTSASDSSDFR